MYLLTIDTGTTNSRVTLWKENRVVDKITREVGVRDTAVDGTKLRLQTALREAIRDILGNNEVPLEDVSCIIASGMITSNVGLVEVPHLSAPITEKDLAFGMVKRVLPEVVDKEIWFVPGVKNQISVIHLENCEEMDMMRGEETETIGLIHRLGMKGPAILILPGSHSKIVSLDGNNKITGCLTSLTGELLSVITHNTIIANALDNSFAGQLETEYVVKGYETSKRSGLNRTCFTIRILDQFTDLTINQKANFLLGAVLADDLKAIKCSRALQVKQDAKIVIAGKDILRDAFAAIIEADGHFKSVIAVGSEIMQDLAGYGAICIDRRRGH